MLLIFFVLLLLWGVGMLTAYTLGGLLHLVLLVALVAGVVHLFRRRRRLN